MQRQEELRKLQEQQNQNKMVADGPTAIGWPDNEVQSPASAMDKVAGALRVGQAGDASFAKQLLDTERRTGDGAGAAAAGRLDGAKERVAGALNPRGVTPAVER